MKEIAEKGMIFLVLLDFFVQQKRHHQFFAFSAQFILP